jgi:hypothetical protein
MILQKKLYNRFNTCFCIHIATFFDKIKYELLVFVILHVHLILGSFIGCFDLQLYGTMLLLLTFDLQTVLGSEISGDYFVQCQ